MTLGHVVDVAVLLVLGQVLGLVDRLALFLVARATFLRVERVVDRIVDRHVLDVTLFLVAVPRFRVDGMGQYHDQQGKYRRGHGDLQLKIFDFAK